MHDGKRAVVGAGLWLCIHMQCLELTAVFFVCRLLLFVMNAQNWQDTKTTLLSFLRVISCSTLFVRVLLWPGLFICVVMKFEWRRLPRLFCRSLEIYRKSLNHSSYRYISTSLSSLMLIVEGNESIAWFESEGQGTTQRTVWSALRPTVAFCLDLDCILTWFLFERWKNQHVGSQVVLAFLSVTRGLFNFAVVVVCNRNQILHDSSRRAAVSSWSTEDQGIFPRRCCH